VAWATELGKIPLGRAKRSDHVASGRTVRVLSARLSQKENPMRLASIIPALALSLALVACGGDNGGGGGGGSGIPSSTTLDQLTDEQIVTLCEYVSEQFNSDSIDKVVCHYIALAFGSEMCEADVEECLAEPSEPADCSMAPDDELPACASQVTVGELEACLNEQAARFDQLAAGVSCSSDPADLEAAFNEVGPACMIVQQKCPELIGGEG
jgi:hypothetical protein